MKTMTAVEAKNSFGKFLDSIQHEPTVITKKNRPVGVALSMQDVETLFGDGEDAIHLALEDARLERQLAVARQQVADGKTVRADKVFFDALRSEITTKYGLK